MPWFKQIQITRLALLFAALLCTHTAQALEVVGDPASIDAALTYGVQKQGQGYRNLLGNNWREGERGSLLNIYTPFMQLALKGYKSNIPVEHPTDDDIKQVRKTARRLISGLNDGLSKQRVRFVASLTGATPDFAAGTRGVLEGYQHGSIVALKPIETSGAPKAAALIEGAKAGEPGAYEAVLSFEFRFDDVANFDKYALQLYNPNNNKRWAFQVRNIELK
ncbi:MAG: hypothetical protein VKJ06_07760 [Vampirovibrionales bacterium]|nr:hypothetical protein [Vampirovibrionales bacterium]